MSLFKQRRRIAERDGEQCFYCHEPAPFMTLTIDHYIPKSKGGADTDENRRLACKRCNSWKGPLMPEAFIARLPIYLRIAAENPEIDYSVNRPKLPQDWQRQLVSAQA